jgi:hypothetical protein
MMTGQRIARAWGRAPLGLLGMVVLVASAERWVARHDADFSEICTANWQYSERLARRNSEPGAILCFGTSLAKFGVVARLLEQETGRRAVNLAVCNGHMPSSYYLFKRALDTGAKPSAVLVDCQDGPEPANPPGGEARAEAIRVNLREWPELLTWGECLDLAWSARDSKFVAEMAVSRLVPSYKARYQVRSSVLAALRGESGSSRNAVLAARRNWAANRGTQLMPRRPGAGASARSAGPAADRLPAERPADPSWRNRLSEEYTRRFLALAAARGIPVFWLIPPFPPETRAEMARAGMISYRVAQALQARATYPGVTVIDGLRASYGADVFWDKVHLGREGACAFSADVGRAVARALGGPGERPSWVTLPPYRGRAVTVAAEDFDQSLQAVALPAGKVRR